jgi:acetyl-CoA acetyltransferase
MKDVVIVSACRTAIGAFGGTLRDINGAAIGSITMKEAPLSGRRSIRGSSMMCGTVVALSRWMP